MELIDITPGDSLWPEVWALYEGSFPLKERRSAANHANTLAEPGFRTKAAVGDGQLLGLLFYWDSPEEGIYIEHLAVNPSLRGQNIGSRLLGGFLNDNKGRRVVLEIDPPEDEISVRRLHFYERLGFVANSYHYIHPGFGPEPVAIPHRLVLLSYPNALTAADFASFDAYVRRTVLRVKD